MPRATATPTAPAPRPPARPRFAGLRKGFIAFTYRNYRLFWLGQLVSVTGTWMQSLAQSWLVYEILNASPFQLGLVNVLQFLPVLLFGIPAGIVADRYPKRSILMVTQSIMMLLAALLAVLVITDVVQLWHVYVIASAFGCANAVDMPTRQAFVSEMVDRDALMNAIALNSALFNTGRIIGPAIAGLLLAIMGPGPLFAINSASYLAVLAGLLMMDTAPITNISTVGPVQRLREGIAYVRGEPLISRTIVMVGMVGIFGMNFNVWVPVLASDAFHAGSGAYGQLFAAMGAGSLFGALSLAFSGRGPNRNRMVAAVFAMGVGEIVLGLVAASGTALLLGALAIAIVGFSSTNTMSTANTIVQTTASDELRGRVMAVYMTVFAGTVPFGALISGWTTGRFGLTFSLASSGTMVVLAGLFQIWAARETRRGDRHAPTEPAGTRP
jgi:MFS family permease